MRMDPDAENPLTGGWVTTGVVRVGDTVRRPPTKNAPLAQRLLEHLEEVGFEAAPRFLGIDEQGREILTFIEGDVPSDCRTMIWGDDQLVAAASLLGRFHAATAGHAMAADADAVCHNDFGPWNLVWKDDMPVGIIDFDEAAPGTCLDDLGYAIWKHLNLGLVDLSPREHGRRLKVMCTAYGVPPDAHVLTAIERAQRRMQGLITAALSSPGKEDALLQNEVERSWLRVNGAALVE